MYPLRFYTRSNIEFDRRCEQAGMTRQKMYDNINKRMKELSSSKRTAELQERKGRVTRSFWNFFGVAILSLAVVGGLIFASN